MDRDEIKYYQPRFARWISSNKWDAISEKLPDMSIALITQIMNAEYDEDCSWIICKSADYVLEQIRKIAKKVKLE